MGAERARARAMPVASSARLGRVDPLAQPVGQRRGEAPAVRQQRLHRAARPQRLGGEHQPQQRGLVMADQVGADLDPGLGPPAAADAHAEPARVQAHAVPLHRHDPGQALQVRAVEGQGDGRGVREAGGGRLLHLPGVQQHGDGAPLVACAQHAGRRVQPLHAEAEAAQQLRDLRAQRRGAARPGLRQPRAGALGVVAQHVVGQQALVAEAREPRVGLRGGQRVQQVAQRGGAVRLLQRAAAQPLGLPDLHPEDARRVAGGAADPGAVAQQRDGEQRRGRAGGPSKPAGAPSSRAGPRRRAPGPPARRRPGRGRIRAASCRRRSPVAGAAARAPRGRGPRSGAAARRPAPPSSARATPRHAARIRAAGERGQAGPARA